MSFDPTDSWFYLRNWQVKFALAGYDDTRAKILDLLLAEESFKVVAGKTLGPFNFDLGSVNSIRKAMRLIVAPSPKIVGPWLKQDSRQEGNIDAFRRELIFATADATRRDSLQLVLHLYTALMERHSAQPPDDSDAGKRSIAGEYLLRCLAVQAAYDNFVTYRFVIEQFARVVAALNWTAAGMFPDHYSALLAAASAPLDGLKDRAAAAPPACAACPGGVAPPPVAQVPPQLPLLAVTSVRTAKPDLYGDYALRDAFAFGGLFGRYDGKPPVCVMLACAPPRVEVRSLGSYFQLGAIQKGSRAICLIDGAVVQWKLTRQTLTLIAPWSLLPGRLAKIAPGLAAATRDDIQVVDTAALMTGVDEAIAKTYPNATGVPPDLQVLKSALALFLT